MIASRLALVVGQLQRGGAERQLFELAIRLDRSRLDPLVVCLSEVVDPYAGKLTEAGIDVVVLPRAGHRDFSRVRSLAGILSRHRIDLVHSFLIAANAYTWAATRLAGRRPYIASSRTCIPPRGRLGLWVHRRAFRGAQAVIANAKAVMEFTRDLYALPESRFTVIPNGVDLAPFEEAGRDREARRAMVRALFGLDDGEAMTGVQPGDMSGVVAGVVGRLSPEKNLPLLLEVARRLRSAGGLKRRSDGRISADALFSRARATMSPRPWRLATSSSRHRTPRGCRTRSWRRWRRVCLSSRRARAARRSWWRMVGADGSSRAVMRPRSPRRSRGSPRMK